jgi:hypothetical protein
VLALPSDVSTASSPTDRRFTALLVFLALVAWLPLALERFPPITDLPEHEAAIGVMAGLLRGDAVTAATWWVDPVRSQYLLYDFAGALLALVTGSAVVADRLLLALVAVAYPLSAARLLRALGRDRRLAIFACMPFFGRALVVGFLPFCASVPLAFFLLAEFVRQCREPSWGRASVLVVLAVALFYLHVDAYVVAALVTALFSLILRLAVRPVRIGRAVRGVALDLAPWVPSVMCALRWTRAGSLEFIPGRTVGYMSLWRSVKAVPLWIHDPWPAKFDDVAGFVWWTGILLVVASHLDAIRRERRRDLLLLHAPLALCIALVVALPFHVGAASMLNVRLATFVALAVLLPLPAPRGKVGVVALVCAGVATVILSVGSARHMRRARQADLGDFASLIDRLRPGDKVELLHFQTGSSATYFPPWLHVGAYHVALHGGVSEWTFAHLAHWPVHVKPEAAPPPRPAFWDTSPCLFRNAVDGAWANWVMVEGPNDPFATEPPGPRYERAASSGRFVLYRRVDGTWDGDPALDVGPCR